MCFPAIAGISGFQMLSMGFSLFSSVMDARAQQQQADYNAAIDRNNAIAANYQAQSAIEKGEVDEKQSRLQTKRLAGQQTAALAANGIQLGSGSAADVLADTAEQGELDAQTTAHNAQLAAWGYKNQADNYNAQAVGTEAAGRSNATGSLLSGIGTVADKWYGASTRSRFA